MLLCTTKDNQFSKKKELILRKLNFMKMKIFSNIACNLNSNSIKWNANGCKKYLKFACNYHVEKIILKNHFFIFLNLKMVK